LESRITKLVSELDEFMNDDFNTARVLANMFELVHIINSMKDKTIPVDALSAETFAALKKQFSVYLEEILGLKNEWGAGNKKLENVLELLIDIRKEARAKKDFITSDKIRNQLQQFGILLKDEKDGSISFSFG
ncbi:MAG: cysteine--tRNA ligase, partial [Bacteroidota bacterium]|nr:cysteine--tRNA ligase [Bacteroidota bacterium]